jgi:hypothetical protein
MKVQSLFVVSIICFFCAGAFAESGGAVTGLCKDGTSYTGASKRGACRGHKGVKEWYGDKVAAAATSSPAPAAAEPATAATGTATGLCKDGTPYTGSSKKGACRGHKGIKEWYGDKPAAAPAAPVATPEPEAQASAAATGLCKDGTVYTGTSKRGACRGHKGIKEWYADKPAESVAPAAPVATPAAPAPAAPQAVPATAGSGKVWVNTRSKIYHCEGSKFYGKTKEGEYMTEADAQAKGYAANRKKVCN